MSTADSTLLDLCCSAGGASAGYHRAGFDVTGVDIAPQPNYPYRFVQADALEYLRANGRSFDVIHASPPCQRFSSLRFAPHRSMETYSDMIGDLRHILQLVGRPYIIENVPGAPLIDPVVLCGTQFGLSVFRHRLFESNLPITALPHTPHPRLKAGEQRPANYPDRANLGVYGPNGNGFITVAGHMFSTRQGSEAMGIDWMTRSELAQAIPPDYTEYLGRQVLPWLL